ncbi:MAG: hypothetical protein OXG36_03455 [Caldilineaceae bacterium]|nr:hypothetical protein [Caldilineaceae bacterium]
MADDYKDGSEIGRPSTRDEPHFRLTAFNGGSESLVSVPLTVASTN